MVCTVPVGAGSGLAGDREVDVLVARAGAVDLVRTAVEGDGERDRIQSGREVLLLADDALVLEQLHLGDARRAGVGHREGDRTGRRRSRCRACRPSLPPSLASVTLTVLTPPALEVAVSAGAVSRCEPQPLTVSAAAAAQRGRCQQEVTRH